MIIGNPYAIAIQIEKIDTLCSPCGMFNFIINDKFVPGKGVTIDLYVVITSLKDGVNVNPEKMVCEIGSLPLEYIDFSEGEPEDLLYLNSSGLYDYGCNFWLGFDGDEERLIYTVDYEKTFHEARYPRGTIEKLIDSLPFSEDLVMEKNENLIMTGIKR